MTSVCVCVCTGIGVYYRFSIAQHCINISVVFLCVGSCCCDFSDRLSIRHFASRFCWTSISLQKFEPVINNMILKQWLQSLMCIYSLKLPWWKPV